MAQANRTYGTDFYESQTRGSRESAKAVVPLVSRLVRPASVLDVGCGMGTWLAEWENQDVTDVVGADGGYVDQAALRITLDKFIPTDLRQPFAFGRTFDLVQSLEVAEHIDESCADVFIQSLVIHGDVILFSAAIPGQGGTHHVNEQWPSYWIAKFAQAGFTAYDVIRPVIWSNSRVEPWYRQNILLFSKDRTFGQPGDCRDLVHPELWLYGIDYQQHPREVLRSIPGAATEAIRRKLPL